MKLLQVCIGMLVGGVLATAQNAVSWVASTGNDGNTCVRTSPCRTFASANIKTLAGGTIQAIDAADYGPVNINKAITIDGTGTAAVITAGPLIDPVDISNLGPSDQVTLRHLTLKPGPSQNGFTVSGVSFLNSSTAEVNLEDVVIVLPPSGPGTLVGVGFLSNVNGVNSQFTLLKLRNVRITGGDIGVSLNVGFTSVDNLKVAGAGAGLSAKDCSVTVRDSSFQTALFGASVSAAVNNTSVLLERSELSFNQTGLTVSTSGPTATVRLGENVITGNGTGISTSGGTVISFRTNMIFGNTTDGTSPLSTSLK